MRNRRTAVLATVIAVALAIAFYALCYKGPHDKFDATTHIKVVAMNQTSATFVTWVESPVPVTVRSDIGWEREDYWAWGPYHAKRTITVSAGDLWTGVLVALMGDLRLGWKDVPFRCSDGISVTGDVDAVGHEAVWHYDGCHHPTR